VIINLKPMMDLAAFLGIDKKLIDQES